MSEEFRTVTRKKWIAHKSINKRTRRLSDKGYEKDFPEVDVDKFMVKLDALRERMEDSDYFTQAMVTLKESFAKINSKVEENSPAVTPKRLVCLGIGPFTRNFQALHQLAFILCTQSHFEIQEAIYFDPVFRQSEKEILQKLKCLVMTENCEGKYEADVYTLFYLPHCPNCLTNNLLWSNWQPDLLSNVILINNSFESLSCSKPERLLRLDAAYILDIMPYGEELPLDDDYEVQNIFNDLSVHIFPRGKLKLDDAAFWTKKEAPKYNDNDGEMISAEDFAKLSIA
ncbi:SRR1-like protein isoform X1 [Musca domestica]|uniref:SRR1-like protein n=1 Tax=Musca domestica TaxID=7370 RepID=A0A1I8N7J8_MUSDO|nr:SRR1-like protein isoform X1 [Musca domestica]